MKRSELPSMHVSVSLLEEFQEAAHVFDWALGEHGISITFSSRNCRYKATYLPEVMIEQRWDQREALDSLIRKSGYRGRISDQLIQDIELTRYRSRKYSLSYAEYERLVECSCG